MVLKGNVWKFGDSISTDLITPGRYYHLRSNLAELAKHAMEDADPTFSTKVKKGDFIVAGKNFGLGSSREHAAIVIKLAGVSAVIAHSFARIFYRNAINVGLPLVSCNTEYIDEGDTLEVDLERGILYNVTKDMKITFQPLPMLMKTILQEGGLVPYVKRHGDLTLV
jgi:3-isopropylmalate/(R)-2-methylmalate dehydratase small subunit